MEEDYDDYDLLGMPEVGYLPIRTVTVVVPLPGRLWAPVDLRFLMREYRVTAKPGVTDSSWVRMLYTTGWRLLPLLPWLCFSDWLTMSVAAKWTRAAAWNPFYAEYSLVRGLLKALRVLQFGLSNAAALEGIERRSSYPC